MILDVTLTGAARSCTHFVRLDGAEVLRVAFPVARRRRRPRLHSQIATAVSQTSPDLKERRKGKKDGSGSEIKRGEGSGMGE